MKNKLTIIVIGIVLLGASATFLLISIIKTDEDKARETIIAYFEAYANYDFERMAYITAQHEYEVSGGSPEEYQATLEEYNVDRDYEIRDIEINQLSKYADEHYTAEVSFIRYEDGKENTMNQEVMVVKEEGEWKLDFSNVIETENTNYKFSSDQYDITELTYHYLVNGKMLVEFIWNNKTDYYINFNQQGNGKAVLNTDEGTYISDLDDFAYGPNSEVGLYIYFDNAKGKPKTMQLENVMIVDDFFNGNIIDELEATTIDFE